MKKAIIYGGAFNPPTIAHQAILSGCIVEARRSNSELWIMPSGERLDKVINVGRLQRVQFVEALCQSVDIADTSLRLELCELDDTATETYQTYQKLKNRYPDYQQTWVFGADSITTMRAWGNGEYLWENLDMLVVPRTGTALSTLPDRAQWLRVETPEVSSTTVRKLLRLKRPVEHLVPPLVAALLKNTQ